METNARYVLIGAATVVAILAGLGFFLWLAKVEINRSYTQYDIVFDSVEGLGRASAVRYSGVDVGQVMDIDLNPTNPNQVRVRIEVQTGTPIRLGTKAVLQSQGVTGTSFVGLNGGLPNSPLLPLDPVTGIAVIPSEASVVQGLIEDTPDLLKEAIALLKDVRGFTTDDNLQSLSQILKNVEAATAKLDTAMDDFTRISQSVVKASDQITAFSTRLDQIAVSVDDAVGKTNTVLDSVNKFALNANDTLDSVSTFATKANQTLNTVDGFASTALPQVSRVATDASRLIEQLTSLASRIERDPARFFLGNRTPEYN